MRVLVTGGAGYIGSATTRVLLDAGHQCVVVDTLERGHRGAVDPRATLIQGDVGDSNLMSEALKGVDAVMHLAGYIEVAESQRDPERYFTNNVDRCVSMLDSMVAAGVGAIVFSSTAAVYGQPDVVPITEDAATVPVNAYGESKLRFEQALDRYAATGVRSVRFRYFNVAGAWPDGSMGEDHRPETHIIPNVLRALAAGESVRIFGGDYPTDDGTCVRDFIHVVDLARAHQLALEALHRGEQGGVFNLGNGDGFSNLQVVDACARALQISADTASHQVTIEDRRPGDPAILVADSSSARRRFGWMPQHPTVDEMVSHAAQWHSLHPDGYGDRQDANCT